MEEDDKSLLCKNTLQHFAESVGCKLSQPRLERIVPRVERYFEDIKTLQEVDISDVEPDFIFSIRQELSNEG